MMPLFVEVAALSLAAFSVGLLFAYLISMRRRREY